MTPIALVRRPGPDLDRGLRTHVEHRPVDAARATVQWEGYVAAVGGAGWRVVEVDPAPDCPDGVFVEDVLVVRGGTAVVCRPGAASRRAEPTGAERAVAGLGYAVHRIEPPGTLDGGDVLQVGDVAYVGQGGRTDAEGLRQLAAVLDRLAVRTVPVPLSRVLHLKSAVTALPDGTVIGWPDALDDVTVFPQFLPVPEERGAHVVVLDARRLLLAAGAPRTAALLADLGYTPVPVEIGEFEKLEGCVTCLSVRLRHVPGPHAG